MASAVLLPDGYGTRPIYGLPLDGRDGVALIRDTDGGKLDGDPNFDRAVGPMQFIPSTWAAYGLGGNIHSPSDAIMGAANYLHASGAPDDYEAALFHYNPAKAYVRAIQLYASQMSTDPRAFYEYYNWQVFVKTTRGDRRVTGPP